MTNLIANALETIGHHFCRAGNHRLGFKFYDLSDMIANRERYEIKGR